MKARNVDQPTSAVPGGTLSSPASSGSDQPLPPTGGGRLSPWRVTAHLLLLGGFAVAQPIYDVLGKGAEFFVAHDAQRSDFVALILVLSVLPGMGLAALVGVASLLGRRLAKAVLVLCVILLSALILLPLVDGVVGGFGGTPTLLAALCLGGVIGWSYQRFKAVSSFIDVLTPAILIFPLLFVFGSSVTHLIFPPSVESELGQITIEDPKPVFLLVLDELPVVSLLDEDEQIDATLFPNLAAFAEEAHWFREATTPTSDTTYAVPGLMTGQYPDGERLPTPEHYPQTIFHLFSAAGYHLRVFESHTRVCPVEICTDRPPPPAWKTRLSGMLSDIGVLYLYLVLPEKSTSRLPAISASWKGFAPGGAAGVTPNAGSAEGRPIGLLETKTILADTLQAIDLAPKASLFFLHFNLPHVPWKYSPSGREYGPAGLPLLPHGMVGNDWGEDPWQVQQAWQRHLLQVQYCDRLFGELRQRLVEAGLWQDAIVAVVADHGVSFRVGEARRRVDETILGEIANVPLLLKAPGRGSGEVHSTPVETIDLLPTLADLLAFEIPWEVDGTSLFSTLPRSDERLIYRTNKVKVDSPLKFTTATIREARRQELTRRLALFSESAGNLARIGPGRQYFGSTVESLPLANASATWEVELDQPWQYQDVDLESSYLPSHITGRLVGRDQTSAAGLELVIAVNGVAQAGTRPFLADDGAWRFTSIVPESAFRQGSQKIEVFSIDKTAGLDDRVGGGKLQPLLDRQSLIYELTGRPGQESLVAGEQRFPVDLHLIGTWRTIKAPLGRRLTGWVADQQAGRRVDQVILFVDGRFIAQAVTEPVREDAKTAADKPLGRAGFDIRMPDHLLGAKSEVRLFGLLNGRAGEILEKGTRPPVSKTGDDSDH